MMPKAATKRRASERIAQAWVCLATDDPEAVSALGVARAHLEAGKRLKGLRRYRLFEIKGALPTRSRMEELLHRSSQFYNPHKERCAVRLTTTDAPPLEKDEHSVLVTERGGVRRPAAERWWLHETGKAVEVREGVVWALSFENRSRTPMTAVSDLAILKERRHGLLCNPHSQAADVAGEVVPLPWIDDTGTSGRPEVR